MNYDYGNELAHHGVKGQKWGVIRKRKKTLSGRPSLFKRKHQSNTDDDTDDSKATDKTNTPMTDAEQINRMLRDSKMFQAKANLNTAMQNYYKSEINRIAAETTYAELTKKHHKIVDLGASFLKTTANDVLRPVAIDVSKKVVTNTLENKLIPKTSYQILQAREAKLKLDEDISRHKRNININQNDAAADAIVRKVDNLNDYEEIGKMFYNDYIKAYQKRKKKAENEGK